MPTTPTPPSARPDGPVPMAVWPTAPVLTEPVDLSTTIPALLAQRLIAVYTHPGDTILAAGVGAPTLTTVARELGRQPASPGPTHTAPARARLVILTLGALSTSPGVLADWASHLLPAGLLAAVIPNTTGAGALLCGRVVAAAEHAGLAYLQHVVAITARLVDDQLDPHPATHEVEQTRQARAARLPAHLPVHADVLVFHLDQPGRNDDEVSR